MIQHVERTLRRVTFAADVVVQVIGGDALLLNLRDETVFSLNPTGARIAELVGRNMTLDAIVDQLSQEYGADRREVADDVNNLVQALLATGLVVAASDDSHP